MDKPADAKSLYLDLLKKTLTDFIHIDSEYANGMPQEFWWSKSPFKEWRNRWMLEKLGKSNILALKKDSHSLEERIIRRTHGIDWPFNAHTMIGLKRLDNLQILIEDILDQDVPGDFAETGVWRGGATIFMRAVLKVNNVTDRIVWACDSFEGLPPPEPEKYPADEGDPHSTYRFLAVSQEEVEKNFRTYGLLDDRVRFVKGFFENTLHTLPTSKLSLLRLDGDMYGSTIVALEALYRKIQPGGYVVIDDYHLENCRQAVDDYRAREGISAEIIDIDGYGAYWRV